MELSFLREELINASEELCWSWQSRILGVSTTLELPVSPLMGMMVLNWSSKSSMLISLGLFDITSKLEKMLCSVEWTTG